MGRSKTLVIVPRSLCLYKMVADRGSRLSATDQTIQSHWSQRADSEA